MGRPNEQSRFALLCAIAVMSVAIVLTSSNSPAVSIRTPSPSSSAPQPLAAPRITVAPVATTTPPLPTATVAGRDIVAPDDGRPNLLSILTDDQTVDMMRALPNVQRLLGSHGVTFTNSFAATPLCCPSRAGILTGQYSSHHGVVDNHAPNGGVTALKDTSTLATWLQDAGYRTSLIGKYLNDYETLGAPGIPPGWDDWHGFMPQDPRAYYGYELASNGTSVRYGDKPADYLTDVLADRAVEFLDATNPSPFFMLWAPFAPHFPSEPAPGDVDAFADEEPFRPPSYNRAALGTAAARLPSLPLYLRRQADELRPKALASLLAVDRAVERMVSTLERSGQLDDTVIAFTSDNGHLFGEHRIVNKTWAYEPSIKVPLIVRAPWISAARSDPRLVVNLDLTSTFLELAGVQPRLPQDGRSLVPLLNGAATDWRNELRIEFLGSRPNAYFSPKYNALRTDRYKLIDYLSGDRELYDLQVDPNELINLADAPGAEQLERDLLARLDDLVAN